MFTAVILTLSLIANTNLPFPKHIEPIQYPVAARLAHWEGTVAAHVELDSAGKVTRFSAHGKKILADAAETSMRKWTFYIGYKRTIDIDIEFKLIGKPVEFNAKTSISYDLPNKVIIVTQPAVCDHCPEEELSPH